MFKWILKFLDVCYSFLFNINCGYCHLSVPLFHTDCTLLCFVVVDSAPCMLQIPGGNSWLYNLISTIIGNLKVTISNVHIRYEDSVRFAKSLAQCFNFSCFPCTFS